MDKSETDTPNEEHTTKPKSAMFQCKVCPYNTLRKPFLDKHMQQKHGFSKIESTGPADIETNIKRKKIEKSTDGKNVIEFGCEMCEFQTENEVLLNMHLEVHETKEGEMYQCTQCDFQTVEVSAMRTHETTHKKIELFHCSECDYATRHKCNFRVHQKTHEHASGSEKFVCKYCSEFSSYHRSSLYKHVALKHKKTDNIYQCEHCSYATIHKSHLTTHRKTHVDPSDLPTYHCDICDFETHNQIVIQRHVKKHKERGDRGEEIIVKEIDGVNQLVWFCCNLCPYKAKDQRYVILHKKVHANVDEINRATEEIVYGKRKEVDNGLDVGEK